ncbi:MAG TPA: SRPBCC family protein [Vicinamibacterales bacterium]|nr:SRPBCC family protein [Vicinamibacterales bacterium]
MMNSFLVALVAFGVANLVLVVPGTKWIRIAAISAVILALLWPAGRVLIALLAWLAWPPAFMVAWALDRESRFAEDDDERERNAGARRARVAVAALIAAVAIASLAYRVLVAHNLQQTAALFTGIPTILAMVVVFAGSPRTATGVACKAVTIGLLVSLLFLGEGMLCVAMSAPLFYAIAVGIASTMASLSDRHGQSGTRLFSCILVLTIVPMSLEGVTGFTTLRREESVVVSRIVHASPRDVERALVAPPRFDRVLPTYLRAGFPRPVQTRIERAAGRWTIRLRGGEMRLDGMEARAGDLVMQLEESRPGFVRWRAVSDDSHMTHFLGWREAVVTWEPIDAATTRVTWTLRYRRGLDPAWYFGPWERYAARLAAGYLIDTVATP